MHRGLTVSCNDGLLPTICFLWDGSDIGGWNAIAYCSCTERWYTIGSMHNNHCNAPIIFLRIAVSIWRIIYCNNQPPLEKYNPTNTTPSLETDCCSVHSSRRFTIVAVEWKMWVESSMKLLNYYSLSWNFLNTNRRSYKNIWYLLDCKRGMACSLPLYTGISSYVVKFGGR